MIVKPLNIIFLILLLLQVPVTPADAGTETRAHYQSFADAQALRTFMKWHPQREPWISAHRGNPMKDFPENAIETFEHILLYYPCFIECDVRLSKDGHLVMMHDDTLDRTTTGSGPVSDYSLDELKKLYLKDPGGNVTGFRIPTFAQVLIWAKHRAVLTVDIKRDVAFSRVIQAIRQHNAEGQVIIITYSIDDAKTVHHLAPDLMISASAGNMKTLDLLFQTNIPAENLCVFTGVSEPEPDVYDALHKKGIRTILGTMHNLDQRAAVRGPEVYRKLYANGADILATDNVPLVTLAIAGMTHSRELLPDQPQKRSSDK